ncbi:XdhC family protein [Rhodovibrionaceae bacterium A322]
MTQQSDELIDCMARLKEEAMPFALVTVVRTEDLTSAKAGAKAVVQSDGTIHGWIGGGCNQGAARRAARAALADGQARMIRVRPDAQPGSVVAGVEEQRSGCPSGGTTELFVEPILPKPRLFVLGASPCAQALARLGTAGGYAVTLSAGQADQARLEDAGLLPDTPFVADFALEDLPPGTALVVATQGKGDKLALKAALQTGAGYCAFVGSRRKAAHLKEQLEQEGCDAEALAALRSPAGLDIGARTPEEIALSILAELVVWRSGRDQREAGRDKEVDGDLRRLAQPQGCQGDGGRH